MLLSSRAVNDPIVSLPEWAVALLANARVAHLGLLDEDARPRVQPVTFAMFDGDAWTAIDAKPKRDPTAEPARLRFLRRRPDVALTADRYDDDWDRLAWVQLLGAASVEGVGEHPDAMAALAAKYEQYRRDPPPGPLIRIGPRRALHWRAAEPG